MNRNFIIIASFHYYSNNIPIIRCFFKKNGTARIVTSLNHYPSENEIFNLVKTEEVRKQYGSIFFSTSKFQATVLNIIELTSEDLIAFCKR